MANVSAGIFVFFTIFTSCACDNRRPFYIIAHMVTAIEQVKWYLNLGANVIETDIQFHTNGSVKEAYHGFPCDCYRTCSRRSNLAQFLQYVRDVTDPSVQGNYTDKLIMQFFDLKLSGIGDKKEAGRDIARHVLDFLWSKDRRRRQELRVLVYIDSVEDRDAIEGFIEEFKTRGQETSLKDVGFDGGSGDIEEIRRMLARLGVEGNVWLGDGKSNCVSALYPDGRLKKELEVRDSKESFIKKVYHWTIDLKLRMRLSLNMGVDGMITNDPHDLVEVLEESYYKDDYRLATSKDDPFERYEKK